jgi:hypothetical protein
VALVELVEHHRADAAELGIAHQAPRQDPFGDEADPRARAADVLEAHLVADGLAGRFAELLGDAMRGHARREAAGLEDQDLAVVGEPAIEERARDTRGLARAGRRLEDEVLPGGEQLGEAGQERIDREGEHRLSRRGDRCSGRARTVDDRTHSGYLAAS